MTNTKTKGTALELHDNLIPGYTWAIFTSPFDGEEVSEVVRASSRNVMGNGEPWILLYFSQFMRAENKIVPLPEDFELEYSNDWIL